MSVRINAFPAVLACILLTACSQTSTPVSKATADDVGHEVHQSEIAWFKGDVNGAFEIAAKTNKPVFLYWGAVWCPPCQEIKNTVFKSKDFVTLSKLFVPVYLDGDTKRAQAVGERFGVQGYPTMIVFSPDGEEITRIPGGIDISRYNSVLALSLDRMQPTGKLVQLALEDPDSLTAANFTQLAWYSWGQDYQALPDDAPESLFRDLADLAQDVEPSASARLYMQYLISEVRKDSDDAPVRVDGAFERLHRILSEDELILACWDSLAYWPEITDILVLDDEQSAALESSWQQRLMSLRHHSSLSTAEQLAGWLPLLKFHFDRTDAPLSKEKESQLQADIAEADRRTTNPFARQSVVNQIDYIYRQAHLYDDARRVLTAELDRSAAPWYFMSDLGDLAEQQGKTDEAVDWYRRAWQASKGAATRFQWGASYVRALIRMKPDEQEKIVSIAGTLFDELRNEGEVFSGRNFRVLRKLNQRLDGWQKKDHREDLTGPFISRIKSLCSEQAKGTTEWNNCQTLVTDNPTS